MPLSAGNGDSRHDPRNTPAMRQYQRFKKQHPDCVLFFRLGDFYEMFDDDAKLAHRVLGVTLTQRVEGVPMAGVPYHALDNYLRRMLRAGFRVAVCDQIEDPAQAKGIVDRAVTRLVTPGTLTDDALLEEGRDNLLAAVMFHGQGQGPSRRPAVAGAKGQAEETASIAWAELSTGAFHAATLAVDALLEDLARLAPRELLYVETADRRPPARVQAILDKIGCAGTSRPAWQFRQDEAVETLSGQFQVATLSGFGLANDDPVLGPASAIVHYLLETQCVGKGQGPGATSEVRPGGGQGRSGRIAHLQPPRRFERSSHLVIDQTSLRSLEIERTLRSGSTEGSLLGVLSDCRTAMGKRMLRHWLCFPLADKARIEERQRVVGALVDDSTFLSRLRELLDKVQDVERISGRIGIGRASPRDVVALGGSCSQAMELAQLLGQRPAVADQRRRLEAAQAALAELARRIAAACVDQPPGHLRDGGLFRDGFDAQLDEFRCLQRDSHQWLAGYQKELIEQTGVASLKVGFNKVFGFYIELTAAQRDKAPAAWSRKQTLKNAERFITPELKDHERKVLSAESQAVAREQELFANLCDRCAGQVPALRALAQAAAELDVLACLARRAVRKRYVCPRIVEEPVLVIRAGRHPVLDEVLGERFVPNDVELGISHRAIEPSSREAEAGQGAPALGGSVASLALITGPNMAGKSTYIRQAALIALLAHTGSFVPADEASIGLIDRIFTRVGASDELHAGASTFMVEMTETANICHHASPRSLVILDEIGRGTSTLDGLALAWAIGEHLAGKRCRTLFATHYHEITDLAQEYPNVVNLHVTVREWADQIVFLHRVQAGATDRSYGIHVAKIAGLPATVVQRARQLMSRLEVNHRTLPPPSDPSVRPDQPQLPLFTQYLEHPAVSQLRQLDLDGLTPMDAFEILRRLTQTLRDEQT